MRHDGNYQAYLGALRHDDVTAVIIFSTFTAHENFDGEKIRPRGVGERQAKAKQEPRQFDKKSSCVY